MFQYIMTFELCSNTLGLHTQIPLMHHDLTTSKENVYTGKRHDIVTCSGVSNYTD